MLTQVGNLQKIINADASEISVPLSFYEPVAKDLLLINKDSSTFLSLLIQKKFYRDAIIFLSHGLPKRESVWWGCVCVRQTLQKETSSHEIEALEAAEKWVYSLEEEEGLKAKTLSETLELKTPSSWVAMAAFWSQGNIAPKGVSPVKTPDGLVAHAIAGAIMLAATIINPVTVDIPYEKFILYGLDIANGGNGKL